MSEMTAKELADMARRSICIPGGEAVLGKAIDGLIQHCESLKAENANLRSQLAAVTAEWDSLKKRIKAAKRFYRPKKDVPTISPTQQTRERMEEHGGSIVQGRGRGMNSISFRGIYRGSDEDFDIHE